jgi:hypothetical protein
MVCDGVLERTRHAIERGLTFLQADAVKWRAERTCATTTQATALRLLWKSRAQPGVNVARTSNAFWTAAC